MKQKIPMLTSRDFCMMGICRDTVVDGNPATMIVQQSINMKGYETPANCIRASTAQAVTVSQHNGTDIRISAVQWIEMGGWFPDQLMSWVMSWSMNTNMDKMEQLYKKMNDQEEK